MTDELLEHFDISGFHWPPRWEHIRGEDYVSFSCDVEERAWENYEKRCPSLFQHWIMTSPMGRFGCRPPFPNEAKSWKKSYNRFKAEKKRTFDGISFPAKHWCCTYCTHPRLT
jgi:hypothetical protein